MLRRCRGLPFNAFDQCAHFLSLLRASFSAQLAWCRAVGALCVAVDGILFQYGVPVPDSGGLFVAVEGIWLQHGLLCARQRARNASLSSSAFGAAVMYLFYVA